MLKRVLLSLVSCLMMVLVFSCEKQCSKEKAVSPVTSNQIQKPEETAVEQKEVITESGTFDRIAGVGGESSGYGLKTDKGETLELDLASGHRENEFVPGLKVLVTGFNRLIKGLEAERKVLVVEKLQFVENNILLRGVFRKENGAFFLGGVELDLKTNKLEKEYADNKEVKVVGTYTKVTDKNKKERQVLLVHRINPI